jgi:hypothetical protein
MNHEKIVILPCDNVNRANEILHDLIYNQAYVLLVVLGDNSQTNDLLELGSRVAGNDSDPGLVVWINNPSVVLPIIRNLEVEDNSLENLDIVSAFMLSIMDKVVDVIYSNEPKLNILRVYKSFQLAL